MKSFLLSSFILILFFETLAGAQPSQVEVLKIRGDSSQLSHVPGSGQKIDYDELEKNVFGDIHQILKSTPGVFVQEEDGFGLRPNIGLRGAHPHRSKKITLMEDGLLVAPAPYSAPAAYYFPTMDSLNGVEVYKGPSSTRYGPNSIGGAINLLTRTTENSPQVEGKFVFGSHDSRDVSLLYNKSYGPIDFLIQGGQMESSGFKQLPDASNTGFDKTFLNTKLKYNINEELNRSLLFNFSTNREQAQETYLGLSRADFSENGLQRYYASKDDHFTSTHQKQQLIFSSDFSTNSRVRLAMYNNQFKRLWFKFNNFSNKLGAPEVLDNPRGSNSHYYRLLKLEDDSNSEEDQLIFGHNHRSYFSQGLQADFEHDIISEQQPLEHLFRWGARYHTDGITRNHRLQSFAVVNAQLKPTSSADIDSDGYNRDTSSSLSSYLNYSLIYKNFELSPGLRFDHVESRRTHLGSGDVKIKEEDLFTPGVAALYNFENQQLFIGAHKGMNIVGPGQDEDLKPEEALNYELGYRYHGPTYFETIGFYSDYKNFVGICSFSQGCTGGDIDSKFNGGQAEIYGLENSTGTTLSYAGLRFPLKLSFTYTQAHFTQNFESSSPEWGLGLIEAGSPLPYIPKYLGQLQVGLKRDNWSVNSAIKYQSISFDQALEQGQKSISAYGTVDLYGQYKFSRRINVFIKIDNILDHRYLVSYRPLGARPGKPFSAYLGATTIF